MESEGLAGRVQPRCGAAFESLPGRHQGKGDGAAGQSSAAACADDRDTPTELDEADSR